MKGPKILLNWRRSADSGHPKRDMVVLEEGQGENTGMFQCVPCLYNKPNLEELNRHAKEDHFSKVDAETEKIDVLKEATKKLKEKRREKHRQMAAGDKDKRVLQDREEEVEWVMEVHRGIFLTLASEPKGGNRLVKIHFRQELFSGSDSRIWWMENWKKVADHYSIRIPQDQGSSPYDQEVESKIKATKSENEYPRMEHLSIGSTSTVEEVITASMKRIPQNQISSPYNQEIESNLISIELSCMEYPSTGSASTAKEAIKASMEHIPQSKGSSPYNQEVESNWNSTENENQIAFMEHQSISSTSTVQELTKTSMDHIPQNRISSPYKQEEEDMLKSIKTESELPCMEHLSFGSISSAQENNMEMVVKEDKEKVVNMFVDCIVQEHPGVFVTVRCWSDGRQDLHKIEIRDKSIGVVRGRVWWEENKARLYRQYTRSSSTCS